MGFLDALFGRSTPKKADLDALFALPPALLTLEAATGFRPTGVAAVAFREVEGGAFDEVEAESRALLGMDGSTAVRQENDGFGFTWQVITDSSGDASRLVASLHAVNSSLEVRGFGPMLLCSTVYVAAPDGRRAALVYLYKRGTFYPFAPNGERTRDSALEIHLRGVLAGDLPVEDDLSKWSPVWGAPGMTD